MEDCIFCKIVKGEIPSHRVYEDEMILAFLDIHPLQPGHTLVIPKVHNSHFEQLPDEHYSEMMLIVKRLAAIQKDAFNKARACIRIEGFDVPHAHVHVYPAESPEEFYGDKNRGDQEPDHDSLAKMAKKLHFE